MTRAEQIALGLSILRASDAAITTQLRAIRAKHPCDGHAWCVVVAPAKGLPNARPDTPGERTFAVSPVTRAILAEEFLRCGFPDIARELLEWRDTPRTYLVVVTCPELTQLHRRPEPAARGVA